MHHRMTAQAAVAAVALALCPGCELARTALGDPGDAHVDGMVMADGNLPDAGPDAVVDAFVPDAFIDSDGGPDSGPTDSGSDAGADGGPSDAGRDAGTDAGFDTCSDETGICLHFQNVPSSPAVVGWLVDVIWTHMDGTIYDVGWMSVTCNGGLRTPDAVTSECLMSHPSRPADAVGVALVYLYPVYAGMVPVCSVSGCPNYPAGYAIWSDTIPVALTTEVRNGTPAGRITVIRTAF